MHKGVLHQSAVTKTDYGIAWVNRQGCYFYDGKQVTDLIEKGPRRIISTSDWNLFTTDNSIIGYVPAERQSKITSTKDTLPLPDKPSIAVLPFDNMSGDLEQEYFADGVTEDIITELSRFQTFFVIARNSSFAYKGKSMTVQDIGRELGVLYVLEGSVRKAGDRVRITAQLIEAAKGNHIWAERYDRELTDVFKIQDDVTKCIVAAIPGRLLDADLARIKRKPLADLVAYDYTIRGKIHHHRGTKEDNAEALRLLGKAIEIDPEFA